MNELSTVNSADDKRQSYGHAGFVHLRVHSAYSLSESTLRLNKLAELASADHQPALAITDSFNLFGAFEFTQKMMKIGIQPIIGAVVNLRDQDGLGEVVLLAQNEAGYVNLSDLISKALLTTDPSQKPEILCKNLAQRITGLLLLSGGYLSGFLGQPAWHGQDKTTARRAKWLKSVFGKNAYIELQRHGRAQEEVAEALLLALADEIDLPLVATNDCHFETEQMHVPQRVLRCIAQSERLASMDERGITPHHYFKTAAQMVQLFADLPEAVHNTLQIAKRCSFVVGQRKPILPSTDSTDENEHLRSLAAEGLANRLAALERQPNSYFDGSPKQKKAYADRLDEELDIIINMEFPGYFLIVSDFIRWAKDQQIPVGPGRGSGAGSVVAWALQITDLDPIRWGLLFERFLNPERVSMPDFDIDFCQERREEVIRYVQDKYGKDRVAQIITFGTLQARAALRDVGRVLDMPYGMVDRIAKLVPNNPANPTTIEQALVSEDELRTLRDSDEQVEHLVSTAIKLEGLYRHASTHAAGLVIADRYLPELVPVYRDPRSDMPVTQFNMKAVEQVGLVKFDFLGLKTLTVINKAVSLLKIRGIDVDINSIPLNDAKTFQMLTDGDTVGVFQLESSGMREVLRGLKPDRFEDIIAVVALYRPGPMENIPAYISRKHGREEVVYMHALLEPILAETYGIMIYQEQVQQAARDLAGYTLGGADLLRRAMGKKIKEEMDQQRDIFVKGAGKNNISAQLASDIFEQIASFAGYGFNKSHAAAYALVCYQTAFLKANYPVEFMAASMTLDYGNTDKLAVFRQDCRQNQIDVLPPDLNKSGSTFRVESCAQEKLALRYALGAVRNVGAEAMEKLNQEKERSGPFQSLEDFAKRMPKEACNKRQLENLVKAGALDCVHGNRRQTFEAIDQILSQAEFFRREAVSTQSSLFGSDAPDAAPAFRLSDGPDWTHADKLRLEFEALGLYLSSHPMDEYETLLKRLKITRSDQVIEKISEQDPTRLRLAGQISSVQERVSGKGNRFAFVQLTDKSGSFEVTLFSDTLLQYRDLLKSEGALLVTADARRENETIRLLGVRLQPLEDVIAQNQIGLGLWIDDLDCLDDIKALLRNDGGGHAPLKFFIDTGTEIVEVSMAYKFRLSGTLREGLKSVRGVSRIQDI